MIYLISDTHFQHRNVIDYCGRPENHEELIKASLKQLKPDDVLFHLGDIGIGKDEDFHIEFIEPIRSRTKILIRGNHDKKSDSWYLNHGWTAICEGIQLKLFGKRLFLTHRPPKDALALIRALDLDFVIYGHVHNDERHVPQDNRCLPFILENEKYRAVNLEKFIAVQRKKAFNL